MTFQLMIGDNATLLGGTSALIKAADRHAFGDAHDLLEAARTANTSAHVAAAQIRADAHAQGLREAAEAAREDIVAQMASAVAGFAAEVAVLRAEVAQAAFAATRSILGTFDDSELAARLADHATLRFATDQKLTVHAAAAVASAVAARLEGREGVTVVVRDDLGPLEMVVQAGDGRVLAGLDVQLAQLADRWGVAQ